MTRSTLVLSRFKTYEHYRNDVLNVFDLWDRTKGITRSPVTPTNQSEDDHATGAGPAGGKKSTQKKEKSKSEGWEQWEHMIAFDSQWHEGEAFDCRHPIR